MSTQKRKFELFARLQALGFTYEESAALRRIEMTLQRWGEMECGDGSDWAIERDEATGKPFMTYHGEGKARRYPIADREAGAIRRLAAIVDARNTRERSADTRRCSYPGHVFAYHQSDPRGCALYLLRRSDIPAPDLTQWQDKDGAWRVGRNSLDPYGCKFADANAAAEFIAHETLSSNYSRGIAVCA